ncbi:hypothetical protein DAI22_02g322900 [Oryza sativa Japonica Group]|nr:hypothetical protein DAI22_02g322900 [Oryza sativa Japonica Group]
MTIGAARSIVSLHPAVCFFHCVPPASRYSHECTHRRRRRGLGRFSVSAPASSFAYLPSPLHCARLSPLHHATLTLLPDDLYHATACPTEEAVAAPRLHQHPAPVGARRAVTDAGRRSSHRLSASRGASDGGQLSPLSGRAAGGSPALRDSACPPLGRGGNSASPRVSLCLAGRSRLRSHSASPRPHKSLLQLPLSVAPLPPSQPPAADTGSQGGRGV